MDDRVMYVLVWDTKDTVSANTLEELRAFCGEQMVRQNYVIMEFNLTLDTQRIVEKKGFEHVG